jgi:hypothetical protein
LECDVRQAIRGEKRIGIFQNKLKRAAQRIDQGGTPANEAIVCERTAVHQIEEGICDLGAPDGGPDAEGDGKDQSRESFGRHTAAARVAMRSIKERR